MTELESLRAVAHAAARYLKGDGSRAELAKALQARSPYQFNRWTHISLGSGRRGRVQGEEGQNLRMVDDAGNEHLVPKASSHLSWVPCRG